MKQTRDPIFAQTFTFYVRQEKVFMRSQVELISKDIIKVKIGEKDEFLGPQVDFF